MSRKERIVAALLLAIAVAGGAVIPRLLASPATPLGVALGPGPGRSVVQAPAIAKQPHHAAHRSTASPLLQATPIAPVTPQPMPTSSSPPARHAPTPTPVPSNPPPTPLPPPTITVASPPPVVTPPPPLPPPKHAKTPPGHAKRAAEREKTPPGQTKTPRGHEKSVPVPAPTPAPAKVKHARDNGKHDVPGSGHGQGPQVPPKPVGHHHRGVGHLASTPARSAPPGHERGKKARPKAGGGRGKGGHEPPPSPPVAPAPPAAPPTDPGDQGKGKGKGKDKG